MDTSIIKTLAVVMAMTFCSAVKAQENSSSLNAFDGIVVMGYVDGGAYLNFTGPNIKWATGEAVTTLGMLPSLRIKQDNGATQHSLITPNLGIGITYEYNGWAFQVPLYYNPKTTEENGQWNVGVGVGFRL
ncbi:MAG: hypothetical protein ACO3K3_05175 [Schleiferiaceae bacterium]|jgi:hypothetical protein